MLTADDHFRLQKQTASVLIRNSLCTKSTHGIHCVLSLQSQPHPNNRDCRLRVDYLSKTKFPLLNASKYSRANGPIFFRAFSLGANLLSTERVLWERGCYGENGCSARSAPSKLVVVKSLDRFDAREFP